MAAVITPDFSGKKKNVVADKPKEEAKTQKKPATKKKK